jgi:hypothetical protein
MAFSMNCSNKGCGAFQEPYIDPATNKVYCSICDKEIQNVTIFTKNQMKSSKQFKKKTTTSFAVKCDKCGKEDRPKLLNNNVVCSSCKKPLDNLSEAFIYMLKQKLKGFSSDI